jgi:hypothetical protein
VTLLLTRKPLQSIGVFGGACWHLLAIDEQNFEWSHGQSLHLSYFLYRKIKHGKTQKGIHTLKQAALK